MKNLKLTIMLFLAFGLFASCKQSSKDDQVASLNKGDSIKIFAQDRPGGEPFDF